MQCDTTHYCIEHNAMEYSDLFEEKALACHRDRLSLVSNIINIFLDNLTALSSVCIIMKLLFMSTKTLNLILVAPEKCKRQF